MPALQSFLDNLENLRIVMSTALEYVHEHRDKFAKSATGVQVRQAEKAIHQIRVLAVQLEKEFTILEYLIAEGGQQPDNFEGRISPPSRVAGQCKSSVRCHTYHCAVLSPSVPAKALTSKQLSSVPCPRCGVSAGMLSERYSGVPRKVPHPNRKIAAVEAVAMRKLKRRS